MFARVLLVSAVFSVTACSLSPIHATMWEQGQWQPQHHTFKELRDMYVVKQQEDYSCGAAALATLMIYYFGDATSEKELLVLLETGLNDEDKRKKMQMGFSLLDLKHAAQAKGYRAAGFKLTVSQLAQVTAPVMVFLEPGGYKHFAVYRGLDRGRVYIADPARGNLRMSLGRFLDEWSGIVFVLAKGGEAQIADSPLALPRPLYVQPELARLNGLLDIGMITRTLPQQR